MGHNLQPPFGKNSAVGKTEPLIKILAFITSVHAFPSGLLCFTFNPVSAPWNTFYICISWTLFFLLYCEKTKFSSEFSVENFSDFAYGSIVGVASGLLELLMIFSYEILNKFIYSKARYFIILNYRFFYNFHKKIYPHAIVKFFV